MTPATVLHMSSGFLCDSTGLGADTVWGFPALIQVKTLAFVALRIFAAPGLGRSVQIALGWCNANSMPLSLSTGE